MSFGENLRKHIAAHDNIMPRDIIKFCYQAAFGCEHLIKDPSYAMGLMEEEFAQAEAWDVPLIEPLNDKYARADIHAWKFAGYDIKTLLDAFILSAKPAENGRTNMEKYVLEARDVIMSSKTAFSIDDYDDFLVSYREMGMPAVHHSQAYHDNEKPAYRVVDIEVLKQCAPNIKI